MIPYLTVFGLIWDALHQLCDRFRGTVVAQRGESVLTLYSAIEQRTTHFQEAYNIHCLQGCGNIVNILF